VLTLRNPLAIKSSVLEKFRSRSTTNPGTQLRPPLDEWPSPRRLAILSSMASIAPRIPTSLPSTPITSIQPGGGFCFGLERAWGRWRRGWLRRFRPGYVRRMASLRQGHCPDCPHDLIDARDLKLYRNVCGHWFRPEDDAFAWRGRLRLARAGLAELLFFSAIFFVLSAASVLLGILVQPWLFLLLILVLVPWLFVLSFFRDPERAIPADPDALVSPADGTVTHVGEASDADFPGGRAFTISIFLSVFNVHVNRVPRAGRVAALRYYPGEFLDARAGDCSVRNEQFWIDLTDARTGGLVRTKQIAGAIARRIVCWLKPDEEVRAGDRLGMIKFGSRTEISVSAELVQDVLVKVGDTVHGGSTILLRVKNPTVH
jgi:phosphatidylserine decarboxylase